MGARRAARAGARARRYRPVGGALGRARGRARRASPTRAHAARRCGARRRACRRPKLRFGAFDASLLDGVDLVCLSPGLSLAEPRGAGGDRARPAGGRRHRAVRLGGTRDARCARDCRDHRHQRQDHRDRARRPPAARRGRRLRGRGQHRPCGARRAAAPHRAPAPPRPWVLELSSYQLETTWSLEPTPRRCSICPRITSTATPAWTNTPRPRRASSRAQASQVLNRDDARSAAHGRSRPRAA